MNTTCSLLLLACLAHAGNRGFPSSPMHEYQPQVGDILLFQGPGGLKNLMYALGGSACTMHSAIVVQRPDGSLGMLEAPGLNYPVMISDIPSRLPASHGKTWVRRRCVPVTPEQSACLTAFACAQEGKPYSAIGFILPSFGLPLRKLTTRCLTAEQLDHDRWICSSIVAAACAASGLLDPCKIRPRLVDPADLKNDRCLDLSNCWAKPEELLRCGPEQKCWFSISCCGVKKCWTH